MYLDDVIVIGKTFEDMISNLDRVFTRKSTAGLKLNAKNFIVCKRSVVFKAYYFRKREYKTNKEINWLYKNLPTAAPTGNIALII